ncbi:MAG: GGDEF domain-containing protein [Saccharofermentans sp.]|nr:GGDEF domain-containing protein [Saccharofermentans sp.]
MGKVLERFKKIILYAGLDKEEFEGARPDFVRLNYANLRVFASISILYLIGLLVSTYKNSIAMINQEVYMFGLIICTIILILSFISTFKKTNLVYVLVYLFLATVLAVGIQLGLSQPDQLSATFLIFLMTAPLLFYDKPYRIGILLILFDIIFIFTSKAVKTSVASQTDLLNGVCFGTLSCVLNTRNLMVRCERVWFGRRMQNIAELDVLTGLKNRNSFEQSYPLCASVARKNVVCIFADVNGLHELNNTKGHEAGDEMLKFIAEELIKEFGDEDSYRIGGDEYVVLICDQKEELVRDRIQRVMKIIEDHHYHISVGLVSEPVKDIDMEKLIKTADERMYEAKRQYYQSMGIDRRKR